MPLSANISGVKAVAPFCSDERWQEIKDLARGDRGEVTMDCCGHPAVPRKSPLGTRHFAHRPQSDCGQAGETVHHIFLKEALITALKNQGFDAEPEFQGPGWRADVKAGKGSERFIFEVQWSAQSASETIERTIRYAKNGYHTVWLQRASLDQNLQGSQNTPCFQVTNPTEGEYLILVGGQDLTVADFIQAWAAGRISLRINRPINKQTIHAHLIDIDCPDCGQAAKAVASKYLPMSSACGLKEPLAKSEQPYLRDKLARALANYKSGFLNDLEPEVNEDDLPPMTFTLSGRSDFRQGCASCGSIISNAQITNRLKKLLKINPDGESVIFKYSGGQNYCSDIKGHWCLDGKCAKRATKAPGIEAVLKAVENRVFKSDKSRIVEAGKGWIVEADKGWIVEADKGWIVEADKGWIVEDDKGWVAGGDIPENQGKGVTKKGLRALLDGPGVPSTRAPVCLVIMGDNTTAITLSGDIANISSELSALDNEPGGLAGRRALLYLAADDSSSDKTIWAGRLSEIGDLTIITGTNQNYPCQESLVYGPGKKLMVSLGNTSADFDQWLGDLIVGKINNRSDHLYLRDKQAAEVYAARTNCWRCHYHYQVLEVDGTWISCCGKKIEPMSIWQEAIGSKVDKALEDKTFWSNSSLSKRNFSSAEYQDQGGKIWVNACPQCQATFGPLFLDEAHDKANFNGQRRLVATLTIDTSKMSADKLPTPIEESHYCDKGCADKENSTNSTDCITN